MALIQKLTTMEPCFDFPSALHPVKSATLPTMRPISSSSLLTLRMLGPNYSYSLGMSNVLPSVALMKKTENQNL